jgi:hypothetical protein
MKAWDFSIFYFIFTITGEGKEVNFSEKSTPLQYIPVLPLLYTDY